MTRFRTTIAIIALLVPLSSYSAHADGNSPANALDGKSFVGKIRGTGLFSLIAIKSTLEFKQGTFTWTRGEDFKPAPYKTAAEDGKIIFTAHAVGKEGVYADDYVDWRGIYDGESLRDVRAVWTRKEGSGDWLHDLLLPEVVTFVFGQE